MIAPTELNHALEDVHFDIVDEWDEWLRRGFVSLAKRVDVAFCKFQLVVTLSLESLHRMQEAAIHFRHRIATVFLFGQYINEAIYSHILISIFLCDFSICSQDATLNSKDILVHRAESAFTRISASIRLKIR